MLNKEDIKIKIKSLNFPVDTYALGTSGSLVLFGVKEWANDLDIDCDLTLYDSFLEKGYKEWVYTPKEGHFARIIDLNDDVQLIRKENLNKDDIIFIDGIPVYNIESVRRFKGFLGREKDKKDIELIDKWLKDKL